MKRRNKNKTKGGWFKHPDEHALASKGIKTVNRRVRANPKDSNRKEYTLTYAGNKIKVREIPNAHEPYEPELWMADFYKDKGILEFTMTFHNFSDEYSVHKKHTPDGEVIETRVIKWYRPDGTEVRYEYDYNYYKDSQLVSKLDEYINIDLIELPLSEELWTEILPSKISDLLDELAPDFKTNYDYNKILGDRKRYTIDFDVSLSGDNDKIKKLFEELNKYRTDKYK